MKRKNENSGNKYLYNKSPQRYGRCDLGQVPKSKNSEFSGTQD